MLEWRRCDTNGVMKKMKLTAVAAASALVLPLGLNSCQNFDSTPKNDAATGALIGAGVGAAVAGEGNRLKGAAIGSAVGGAGGYAVGSARR